MPSNQFKLYSEFYLHGKKHKVISIDPPFIRYKRPDGDDLEMSPMNRYNDGCSEVGFPEWIDINDEEQYRMDFMLTLKKPYTRDGIRFDNRIYQSEECHDIIGTREIKYKVKYDPDDISHVYLLHPKKNRFVKLYCTSPSYEQVIGTNSYTPCVTLVVVPFNRM